MASGEPIKVAIVKYKRGYRVSACLDGEWMTLKKYYGSKRAAMTAAKGWVLRVGREFDSARLYALTGGR